MFGVWVIVVLVIGGLIVGLMVCFGLEKICGYGILEVIEVILFGKSCMLLKVVIFKLLLFGVVIGSGGLFGVEGLIIMMGGVFGLLIV